MMATTRGIRSLKCLAGGSLARGQLLAELCSLRSPLLLWGHNYALECELIPMTVSAFKGWEQVARLERARFGSEFIFASRREGSLGPTAVAIGAEPSAISRKLLRVCFVARGPPNNGKPISGARTQTSKHYRSRLARPLLEPAKGEVE